MTFHSHTHPHSGHEVQTKGATIRWARFYDAVVKFMTLGQDRKLRQRTLELATLKPGDKVLDVGCGTGDLTIAASKQLGKGSQVYGIDAASEMIEVATGKAARAGIGVHFQVEAIEHLSFPDGAFDVVLSSLMMHHLPGDLKLRGMKEVYRVLKPGGRVFIVDGSQPSTSAPWLLKHLMSHMVHGAGIEMLADVLKEAGFTQITSGEVALGVIGFVSGYKPTVSP